MRLSNSPERKNARRKVALSNLIVTDDTPSDGRVAFERIVLTARIKESRRDERSKKRRGG